MAEVPKTPRAANVFRSAWIPAPPPESEPAIVSARLIGFPPAQPHLARRPGSQPPAASLLTEGEKSLARRNRVVDSPARIILAEAYLSLDEGVQRVREECRHDRQLFAIQRPDRFPGRDGETTFGNYGASVPIAVHEVDRNAGLTFPVVQAPKRGIQSTAFREMGQMQIDTTGLRDAEEGRTKPLKDEH